MSSKGIAKYALLFCTVVMVTVLAMPVFAFAATPHKVTGVHVASVGVSTATIHWSAASHATYYYIYRGSTYVKRVSSSTRSYTATGLAAGGSYTYKVRAYNGHFGSYSSSVSAKLHPVDLVGLDGDVGTGFISWTPSAGATKYVVNVKVEGMADAFSFPASAGTDYDLAGLLPLFASNPVITVTPYSGYGVAGVSATWEPMTAEVVTLQFDATMADSTAGPILGSYIVTLHDIDIDGADYVVLVDGAYPDSLDNSNGDILTATQFVDYLMANPTVAASCEVTDDAAKTAGTEAGWYLNFGSINLPPEL